MELERNEASMMSNIFSLITEKSKRFESKSGEVEFLISSELLERVIAEAELFIELEKGRWSAQNEPTLTLEEFEKRVGL